MRLIQNVPNLDRTCVTSDEKCEPEQPSNDWHINLVTCDDENKVKRF
jgi:hypothetical protein